MTYITAPDYLIFKNTDDWYVNVQCQNGQTEPTFTYPGTGILYIDSYVNCKKDVNCWGAFITTSPSGITGGGAIQMGHAFTATGDAPMITLIDSGSAYGGYNTLWIKQGDRDPNNTLATNWLGGHLELGNLTAHGIVTATGYTNSSFTHSGDIKSSRGFNTNYTNSTGKTIVVYIAVKFNGHPTSAVYYVEGYINNTPTTGVISNNYNQLYQNIVLVVPHGATYKCACSDTSNTTFDRWVETSL